MSYVTVMSAVLVSALVFTNSPAWADEAAEQIKKLEGTWVLVDGKKGGEPPPDALKNNMKLTIKGDKFEIGFGEQIDKGTFKIVDVKKGHIDFMSESKRLGIIEIKGEELQLCVGQNESVERPTEFKSEKDQMTIYLKMKKSK